MATNSKIEWTTHTFNPWEGCNKVSPGCTHCYAETRNARFGGGNAPNWGRGAPRRRTSEHNWNLPIKWNREAAATGTRPRVFCASLADWLDDEVPASWLFDLITLIHKTPNLDWLLLTKRPQNWETRLRAAAAQCTVDPLDITDRIYAWLEGSRIWHNIWFGTTVEDQARADERIPLLLNIPARIHFLSCEPLLGPLSLQSTIGNQQSAIVNHLPRIHWIICGGESGPGARPMHPEWATSLRDQCAKANVPFLFKQWGDWQPVTPLYHGHDEDAEDGRGNMQIINAKGHLWDERDGQPSCPESYLIEKVGKLAAGRLLDGIEWNQYPAP